ncbi:hypothetical protein [Streptomyces sp. A5-4]|uniref:hypothetical protein n=1 Tax=Streptomyces sp. A5-4 TaxID=3384771 RepID=UPI003DA91218
MRVFGRRAQKFARLLPLAASEDFVAVGAEIGVILLLLLLGLEYSASELVTSPALLLAVVTTLTKILTGWYAARPPVTRRSLRPPRRTTPSRAPDRRRGRRPGQDSRVPQVG